MESYENNLKAGEKGAWLSIITYIILSVGIQVIIEAVKSLAVEGNTVPDMLTGWVALVSSLIMYVVYLYNMNLGKKIKSQSVKAAAKDNLSDALVSIGAFIGISGSQFGLYWLDTFTAVVVGIIIIKTAVDIFKESVLELTDGFKIKDLDEIKKTIKNNHDIEQVKTIKARMHGNQIFVDIVIEIDHNLNYFLFLQ